MNTRRGIRHHGLNFADRQSCIEIFDQVFLVERLAEDANRVLTGVGPAPLGLQHLEGEKSLGFDRNVDGLEHANGTVASLRGA